MTNMLRIPNEPRFVRAFALAVDPGDTLGLLMEIGALSSTSLAIVRSTREALIPAYDRASDLKDRDLAHTIGVLRDALAQPDSAAYLAYRVGDNHGTAHTDTAASPVSPAESYTEALAVIGSAADTLSSRRRPWEIESNDLSLPEWRERVCKLLVALPGKALPKPSAPSGTDYTCNELGSLGDQAGDHAPWCAAIQLRQERPSHRDGKDP